MLAASTTILHNSVASHNVNLPSSHVKSMGKDYGRATHLRQEKVVKAAHELLDISLAVTRVTST